MIISFIPLFSPSNNSHLLRAVPYLFLLGFIASVFFSPDLLAVSPLDKEAVADINGSASILAIVAISIVVLGLVFLSVIALTLWSRKQDDINNMMSFCIKFLIDTKDENERCQAARALGRAKDPGALLVLLDVISDEKVSEIVRKAAQGALDEMGFKYRKCKKLINELVPEIKNGNHQKVIDILIINFEKGEKKYVQSAYLTGREFLRMKRYADAREWLHKAHLRNRTPRIYADQIKKLTDKCNEHLFAEGDKRFKEGDYYSAREHYTLASTGINDEDKRRFSAYLRLACVYCKIGDYIDADQATLQALQHHHQTDMSLRLNKLAKKVIHESNKNPDGESKDAGSRSKIDRYVDDVMAKLWTGKTVNPE